jgi:hypothetical protein
MKTAAQVNALKEDWKLDPCWDIETTEGYEDYKDELWRFRIQYEKEQTEKENKRLQEKADAWGCSVKLVSYIEFLEWRITNLDASLTSIMY